MTNLERYAKAFIDTFEIDSSLINSELSIMTLPAWDSVSHMNLVTALEEEFDLMFDTDDILEFNSYDTGLAVLQRLGIEI
ncbi:MAG: acyl carrier protein [Christensenellales bacterium]|jgi:acyl carrier protein